ncbi:hypothetical protein EUAN_17870 [Andreesenia angusta]|uniref:Uncharacterized protein n=1 Tax=Andreesenia angusta TaxID=39480 RepID=A0A1S1V5J7_9FIRM|nr:hypothetical protein [Andreesenia angusta]OHW61784.1 hypothetical protein EUAN_17870 [Andreesenia angusta]
MDLNRFRKIMEKYVKIYNLNEMSLEGDRLTVRLIYNISKEKLSKPVYRSFETSKMIRAVNLDIFEENLEFIFKRGRDRRIVDIGKILSLLDVEKSFKTEHREAVEEVRLKLFENRDVDESIMMMVLSNDVVSYREESKLKAKYVVSKETVKAYVSSLKLHTVEYLDMLEKMDYDQLFEALLEIDSMVERSIEIQRRRGELIKEGCEITPELLESIEQSEIGDREQRDIFKAYHHYLTNDLNRSKSSEMIKYKGVMYEIVKVGGDGYLIVRHPEKSIVTEDRLIDRIIVKYKMLRGEIG